MRRYWHNDVWGVFYDALLNGACDSGTITRLLGNFTSMLEAPQGVKDLRAIKRRFATLSFDTLRRR
eukprot:scaffold743_cov267-Pinguiococcus_pyrenoidosus.AAC.9